MVSAGRIVEMRAICVQLIHRAKKILAQIRYQ